MEIIIMNTADRIILGITSIIIILASIRILIMLYKFQKDRYLKIKYGDNRNNHKCIKCDSTKRLSRTKINGEDLFLCEKCISYLMDFNNNSLKDIEKFTNDIHKKIKRQKEKDTNEKTN